jgi:TrmH family RNA methyltransferase
MLRELNGEGITVVVTDAHDGTPVDDLDLLRDLCLVFGEEQSGVSEGISSDAGAAARIPMREGIDSLNVASASAAVFYEVWRQRNTSSGRG